MPSELPTDHSPTDGNTSFNDWTKLKWSKLLILAFVATNGFLAYLAFMPNETATSASSIQKPALMPVNNIVTDNSKDDLHQPEIKEAKTPIEQNIQPIDNSSPHQGTTQNTHLNDFKSEETTSETVNSINASDSIVEQSISDNTNSDQPALDTTAVTPLIKNEKPQSILDALKPKAENGDGKIFFDPKEKK